jgi:hypothetical protein
MAAMDGEVEEVGLMFMVALLALFLAAEDLKVEV